MIWESITNWFEADFVTMLFVPIINQPLTTIIQTIQCDLQLKKLSSEPEQKSKKLKVMDKWFKLSASTIVVVA